MATIFNQNWVKKAKEEGMLWGWLLEDSAMTKLTTLENMNIVKDDPIIQNQITDLKEKIEIKHTEPPSENIQQIDSNIIEQAENIAQNIDNNTDINIDTTVLTDENVLKDDTPITIEKTEKDVSIDPHEEEEKRDILPETDGSKIDETSLNVELPLDTPEVEPPKHDRSLSISTPITNTITDDIVITDTESKLPTPPLSPSPAQQTEKKDDVKIEPEQDVQDVKIEPVQDVNIEPVQDVKIKPLKPPPVPLDVIRPPDPPSTLTHEQKWDTNNEEAEEDVDIVAEPVFKGSTKDEPNVRTISVFQGDPKKTKLVNPKHAGEYRLAFLTDDFKQGSGVYEVFNHDTNKVEKVYVDVISPKKTQIQNEILLKHSETEKEDDDLFVDLKTTLSNAGKTIKKTGSSLARMMKIIN